MSFTPFPVALLLTPCVIVVTVGYNGVSNYTVVQRLCQSASLHIWCPIHTHTQADQSCYGFKMHTDVQKHTYLPKCKHVALSINNTVHQEFKPVPLAKTSLLLDLLSLLSPPFHCSFPVTWLPVASNCLGQLRCHGDHAHSVVSQQPLGSPALTFPTAPQPARPGPGPPYADVPWGCLCVFACVHACARSLPPLPQFGRLYKQFNNCWRIHGLSA